MPVTAVTLEIDKVNLDDAARKALFECTELVRSDHTPDKSDKVRLDDAARKSLFEFRQS